MEAKPKRAGLFNRFDGYILAACADPEDAECRRQIRLTHGFAFSGIAVCFVFLIDAIYRGDPKMAGLLGGLLLASVASIMHVRMTKSFRPSSIAIMIVFGAFLIYMLATGGVERTGLIWAFIYPPMVVYALGHRLGMLLAGLFLGAAAVIVFLPEGLLETTYPAALRSRWLGALVFVTAVTLISERSRQRAQQRLLREIEVRRQAEAALQQAKEEAERAARVKGEFLANMSHELRTPLTTLVGMNRLLLDAELNPDQRDLALTMKRSGEHLVAIINDILDLSKLEAGQLSLEAVTVDPAALTGRVVDNFRATALEAGLGLELTLGPDLPAAVVVDPGRLRQVLDNLLSNAFKFTERGQVAVRLEQSRAGAQRAGLRWTVRDTGIGIPVDRQTDIFDAFEQADGSTTRHYGGTGLGLTISRRLVQSMQGRIGLESSPGRGASFWVEMELPIGEPGEVAGPTDPDRPLGEQVRAHLLVVEDDPTNRTLLQTLFSRLGAIVELARDGREAVEKVARDQFDLILMDCHMPRMDGFQAAEEIRRQEREQGQGRTPIVAVTASATEENWRRCADSGMDDCLIKPFEPDALERTVRQWLDERGSEPR